MLVELVRCETLILVGLIQMKQLGAHLVVLEEVAVGHID